MFVQESISAVTVGVAVVLVGLDEAEQLVSTMPIDLSWAMLPPPVMGDWRPRGGDRRGSRPTVLPVPNRRRGWDAILSATSLVV